MENNRRMRVWRISPPELMTWITADQRDRSIALIDFEPDVLGSGDVRIDMRVAFKCVAIRCKEGLRLADFYIGCQSAAIKVEVDEGILSDHTQGTCLSVDYKDSIKRTRNSKVVVAPTLKAKAAGAEIEATCGSVELEAGRESAFERSFKYEDRVLAAVCLGSAVEWRLDSPAEPAFRSFLFCNLHLFVRGNFNGKGAAGRISVRPSDLTFFDPHRKPLEQSKSRLLLFKLWRKRRKVFRPQGVVISFREEGS